MARDWRTHRRPVARSSEELDRVEGRNPVLECLRRRRRVVERILLDERARPGGKVDAILDLAREQGIPVDRVPRADLDRQSATGVHNGVVALAGPLPTPTLTQLLDQLDAEGVREPVLLLVDEVQYEQNLGAVLRSALGAGVHGVVVPTLRGKGLSPVVQRVAMGAAEAVPLVRESLTSSLALLERRGFRIVGADMDGEPVWEVPLTGALALVMGGEDKGLSPALRRRCAAVVSIPLAGDLESLNLSVATGILLFERVRQAREQLAPRA